MDNNIYKYGPPVELKTFTNNIKNALYRGEVSNTVQDFVTNNVNLQVSSQVNEYITTNVVNIIEESDVINENITNIVNNNLEVPDDLSINTLALEGDLNINDDKFIVNAENGNTTIAGTLDVAGTTTFTGNFNTNRGITSGGNVTIAGTLGVTGNTTLNGLINNGTTNLTGNLLLNTDKFTVDASNGNTIIAGNVGIGITSPSSILQIDGTININTGSNLANRIAPFYIASSGNNGLMFDANQIEGAGTDININYNSDTDIRMCIGGGNVGIGTTSPSTKLHVNGALMLGDTYQSPSGTPWTTSNTQLMLAGSFNTSYNTGDKCKLLITGYDNENLSGEVYPIYCEDENGVEHFSIRCSPAGQGNSIAYFSDKVGIGTTNPQGNLHISSGTSGDCALIIESDTDNNAETDNPLIIFEQDGGYQFTAISQDNNELKIKNCTTYVWEGGIVFSTNTGSNVWSNAIDRMRINGFGQVGIGDLASVENMQCTLLQLESSEPYLTLKNSTSENTDGGCESKIIFEDHSNTSLAEIQASHDGTSDDTKGDLIFSTHNGTTLTESIRIDSNQNVNLASTLNVSNDINCNTNKFNVNSSTGDTTIAGTLEVNRIVHISGEQGSAPSAPSDGDGGLLYTKADGGLYWISNELSETNLTTSSLNGLTDCLIESGGSGLSAWSSLYIGNDPSSTTSTAKYNVGVGTTTLDAITTGDHNTAVGHDSLTALNTGSQNTAVGSGALKAITSGNFNTAIGHYAGNNIYTQSNNTFLGWKAGWSTVSDANTYVGYEAGYLGGNPDSDPGYNTALGYQALKGNGASNNGAEWRFNTAIGAFSMYTMAQNTSNDDGYANTGVGYYSLKNLTSGQNNIAVGYKAGDAITTGNNNIVIGAEAAASAADVDNEITIGTISHTKLRTFVDEFVIENDTTNKPVLEIKNTHNGGTAGILKFNNTEAGNNGADDDDLGSITFWGNDDGTPSTQQYAGILAEIHDATSGEESGKLTLQVASHDGGVEDGLILIGGSVDAEVDVTIGAGTGSSTTITGNIGIGKSGSSNKFHLLESSTGTSAGVGTGSMVIQHTGNGQSSIVFPSGTDSGSDYGYIQYSDDGGKSTSSSTENGLLQIGVENDATGDHVDDIIISTPNNYIYLSGNGNIAVCPDNIISFLPENQFEIRHTSGGIITLTNNSNIDSAGVVYGKLAFKAPTEASSVGNSISASIHAISEGNFNANNCPSALVFSTGNTAAASEKMRINKLGYVGIGLVPSVELDVSGSIEYTGTITDTSDDRIKYNEQTISTSTALNIINQLTPKYYEKISKRPRDASGTWIPTNSEWETVKDNYDWHYETGMIAQEVKTIPELEYCVHGTEIITETITDPDTGIETQVTTQTPLYLNYNDIFTYHIAATKELSSKLDVEKAKTAILETQVADLLARVTALENP